MNLIAAVVSGLLFGAGLIISEMANPAKVLNFLDVFGAWDPSLALVMAGALAVSIPACQWAKTRKQSLSGLPMQLPTRRDFDAPLILGTIVFGIGWGLVGLCPGPALVGLTTSHAGAWIFAAALLGGIKLGEYVH